MSNKKIIFLGLLFTIRLLNAQTNFHSGYVIKANSDTLYGDIDYKGDSLISVVCRFKLKDGEEIMFSPNDIIGYRIFNDKFFISKEINGKKVFVEFLIKSQINIYYFKDTIGDHYFIEKEGFGISEIIYRDETRYDEDKKPYYYQSVKQIGYLNFLQDAPEFQKRMAKIETPRHENIIKYTIEFNKKVCKNKSYIVYEKHVFHKKNNFEIVGGIVNYKNLEDYNDKNYFQTGIIVHFGMPSTSKNLYFRTGMLYSSLQSNSKEVALYKIPVQFERIYTKGIVNLMFAIGINFYMPYYNSTAFMGGLNIKLNRSIYLGLNYDIDFTPIDAFPLFPSTLLSQSVTTGLLIKF